MTDYEYYYNNVPKIGLCRNNLIYTSMINKDKTVFVQWYYNDSEYHKGQNQIVDPKLMDSKWLREVNYLTHMRNNFPDLVPRIINIDLDQRKLFLEIDGPDFWEQAGCDHNNFDKILPDWQEQIINIIQAHKKLGLYKYSMHPSSFFLVNGKLKSINYFFTYRENDGDLSIAEHQSHLSEHRQLELRKYVESMGLDWFKPQPQHILEQLCWHSFKTNYPLDFVERVLKLCTK